MNLVILIFTILASVLIFFAGEPPEILNVKKINKNLLNVKTTLEYGAKKIDCNLVDTYCFKDSDCVKICKIYDNHECINGVCKINKQLIDGEKNEDSGKCDPKMGMMGMLVGDTAFGRYVKICKSIDPGIAISNDENLMCKGSEDNKKINYLFRSPQIEDCVNCNKKVIIPATLAKREHAECENEYYDMVT